MSRSRRVGWLLRPGVWVAVLLVPGVLTAADRKKSKPLPKGEVVDVFSAVEKGQIEVQLIAKNEAKCRLIVTNKTNQPLNVMLPKAFAGVPVLAQWDVDRDPADVPQAVGVGPGMNRFINPMMNPMMNVRGRNRGGPGRLPGPLFNIAPEKVGKFKLQSVCLDYGKPTPKPQIKYQIKPLSSYTDKPGVAEVCAMLGRGEVSQRVAQLAVWHLNNEMSWERLANIRQKTVFATSPVYTQKELKAARKAAEEALKPAKQREQTGRSSSLSSR